MVLNMANERRHEITISGITISLSSKKDTYFDLDAEATRSWKTGILKRNRIRKNCLKIECSMENRDADYVDLVLGLLDLQEFQIEVYDRYKREKVTKTMYCSDRSTEDYETVSGTKTSLSFNLIEV